MNRRKSAPSKNRLIYFYTQSSAQIFLGMNHKNAIYFPNGKEMNASWTKYIGIIPFVSFNLHKPKAFFSSTLHFNVFVCLFNAHSTKHSNDILAMYFIQTFYCYILVFLFTYIQIHRRISVLSASLRPELLLRCHSI